MMCITDNNDTKNHYQLNFPEQALSSNFDSCNNIGSSMSMSLNMNMNDDMNSSLNSSMGSIDVTNLGRNILENKLVAKRIRGRNNRKFKELISNFWSSTPNNDSFQPSQVTSTRNLKNTMSNNSLQRESSISDLFGNFHPIELSGNKNASFTNDKENSFSSATMFSSDNLGIDKNLFQSSNMDSFSNATGNSITPPVTQSLSDFSSSRRASTCSSSLICDDSKRSHHYVKPSTTAIIDASINILNGNDFADIIPSNHNHIDTTLSSNVALEPGPYDIVCGRNSGAYNYIGNRRFRVTIEKNLHRYTSAPTREDKTNVIKSIVWMLHEQVGARFLKKETPKKSSGSGTRGKRTPRYTIMTDKQSREKVGHALRDLVITARKEQEEAKKAQQQC